MAKKIVTQELVNEVAEDLNAEMADVTIVSVQSRIGGGSYSTVKRCLDVWRQRQAEATITASEMPQEIQLKCLELGRAVWALSARQAQREAQVVKDEANAQLAILRNELGEAVSEIGRLEAKEVENTAHIEQQQLHVRDVELALAEAQTKARRVEELEKTLTETRIELDKAFKEAKATALEIGKLTGETVALRNQVHEMMTFVKTPKNGKQNL